ncbi:DUF3558 domain-containing protein [Amycolatopsis sp. NPDC059657]|uniref:DUF3558 domain-containing protein n=1 Tax=Amycolatopsis sp. NPDC059657 TaxID=3346899 RepID=UPI0036728420
MNRALTISVTALALGTALTGCSKSSSGSGLPMSTSTSESSAAAGSGSGSAPRVPSPLNTASLLSDACTGLSSSALSQLQLKAGYRRTNNSGPTCAWDSSATSSDTVSISPITTSKGGLSTIYDRKDKQEYFEPTTIGGYPAVFADPVDRRTDGRCSLHVGVTDDLEVLVFTQLSDGKAKTNPCPVAEDVATAMIDTLKAG